MTNDQITRQQLLEQLNVRRAHMNFDDAVADFPEAIHQYPPAERALHLLAPRRTYAPRPGGHPRLYHQSRLYMGQLSG